MAARLYRVPAAAELLGYSRATVYGLIRSGRLRAVRIGDAGEWRVPDDAIPEFIAGLQTNQVGQPEPRAR